VSDEQIDLKNEILIVTALSSCLDILGLATEFQFSKGTNYLFESLFIRLRHLAYYFIGETSPLIQYKDMFNEQELAIMDKLVDIRIASAHPEANQHWLNEHIMISGGMNFKDGDVEIQYGSNKLFLIRDILFIYKRMRDVFARAPELPHLAKHPVWELKTQEFIDIRQKLTDLLKKPEKLLKVM